MSVESQTDIMFCRWIFVILISFVICNLSFITSPAYAQDKELALIYTGETHSMLYHCDCPVEPDGGVARRATLIKQLKKSHPDVLVLDSGNFFSGGLLDQNTQNTQLDMRRAEVNLAAMGLMGYDAVNISDDEFNFGKEFFNENLSRSKLPFVSANLKSDIVSPYIIKEVSGIKVGIVGLTNPAAKQKAGPLQLAGPKQALESSVRQLKKKGVGLVILLSNLGEPGDSGIIEAVPGISVVIDGHGHSGEELFTRVGNTVILRPIWQGRKLGLALLGIKDGKIGNVKVEALRLSDKIDSDPAVTAILPRCFSDNECKKEGLIGACQDPGKDNAGCLFTEAAKAHLTIITAKDCLAFNSELIIRFLRKQFANLDISYIYYPDKKALKLLDDFKATGLPVFLLGKEIAKDKNFDNLKPNLIESDDFYMLKPAVGGISYFIKRQRDKGKLDLFISLFDKDSFGVLNVLKEFNPAVHFLASLKGDKIETMHGDLEAEEDLRAVCVQKHYPQAFWSYITCRAKGIDSSWWDDCAVGMDLNKIKSCARTEEGRGLLKKNCGLNQEVGVMFGPTYLLDNIQIFSSKGAPSKEELKKIIRK
ncbi:MAG: hypothetical protein V1869_02185 [Candidatus Omnitrophota bacterium]